MSDQRRSGVSKDSALDFISHSERDPRCEELGVGFKQVVDDSLS